MAQLSSTTTGPRTQPCSRTRSKKRSLVSSAPFSASAPSSTLPTASRPTLSSLVSSRRSRLTLLSRRPTKCSNTLDNPINFSLQDRDNASTAGMCDVYATEHGHIHQKLPRAQRLDAKSNLPLDFSAQNRALVSEQQSLETGAESFSPQQLESPCRSQLLAPFAPVSLLSHHSRPTVTSALLPACDNIEHQMRKSLQSSFVKMASSPASSTLVQKS